jgi:hypothetical protein
MFFITNHYLIKNHFSMQVVSPLEMMDVYQWRPCQTLTDFHPIIRAGQHPVMDENAILRPIRGYTARALFESPWGSLHR